jgi:hypothetical protein
MAIAEHRTVRHTVRPTLTPEPYPDEDYPMADYFIYCSFNIPLTAEQQDWAIDELDRSNRTDEDTDDDEDTYPYMLCEKRDEYLWIRHSDNGADIDGLCARLQNIMKHFDISGTWGFNWSQDCTVPRTDAYGGGACIVSQDEKSPTWTQGRG